MLGRAHAADGIMGAGTYNEISEQFKHEHLREAEDSPLEESSEMVFGVGLPAVVVGGTVASPVFRSTVFGDYRLQRSWRGSRSCRCWRRRSSVFRR